MRMRNTTFVFNLCLHAGFVHNIFVLFSSTHFYLMSFSITFLSICDMYVCFNINIIIGMCVCVCHHRFELNLSHLTILLCDVSNKQITWINCIQSVLYEIIVVCVMCMCPKINTYHIHYIMISI